MVALDILSDGFFAAIAGIGFGAISDPPLRAFKMIAILAALGHACRCPMTVLYIPALLPMIPGKFAYNMVFSLIMCLQTANKPELHDKYIKMQEMFFSNTLVASTVIFMLAVGATFPMFLFPHRH